MSKRKRSAVWTYFEVDEETTMCNLCKEAVKTSGNTSNLMKHLKSKHFEEFKLVQAEQEETKRLRSEQTPAKKPKQVTLVASLERLQLYKRESSHCKKIDEALVRMLAVDLQPPSIVEDRGFLNFIRAVDPRYQPPSRRTIMRNILPDHYKRIKQELKVELAEVEYCALTTDLWSSRTTQGYITVTCHFISSDWKLRSIVLDTLHC